MSLLSMRISYRLLLIATLFALFSRVGLAQPPSTPKSQPETGIEGEIVVSPAHPGPTRQGIPDSKPLANTEFVVAKEDSTVASFKTDDQGRFQILLPAGHYTISRKDWKATIGRYGPFEVDVAVGQVKKVQWTCDSGMR
jgi:hypothetical protein